VQNFSRCPLITRGHAVAQLRRNCSLQVRFPMVSLEFSLT